MVDARDNELDPYLGAPGDPNAMPEVGLTGDSVAHQLRWARESHGQDLARVAQALRIRYVYLEAIESGRYDQLPGPAYAVGFVRSYAEFLGLNSRETVARFKREVEGLESETELNFPSPNPQGKIPSGIVFLVCALIAALGYGGWLYVSGRDAAPEVVSGSVPERLQSLVQAEGDVPAPSISFEEVDPNALPPDPRTILADDPDLAVTEVAPVEEIVAPGSAVPTIAETVTDPAASAEENPVPEEATVASDLTAGDGVEENTAFEEAAENQSLTLAEAAFPAEGPADGLSPVESDLPAEPTSDITLSTGETPTATDDFEAVFASIPAAPDAGLEPEKRLQPRTYGETNEKSRIVLRALQDSWVQVRDSDGALLLTRVLRVGDSYRVPDQADLTLLTGNAGGLQIEVDGVPLPPLGAIGTVRRDISLDPTQLLGNEG